MPQPITSIHGIGPATAEGFARAGITSAEQLREIGAEAAYEAWIAAGNPPHFIGYYALHMALQGRRWNDCRGAEKAAFRVKFDALKARIDAGIPEMDKGRARLDAALDEIGLIRRD
ncbi:MAG: TfoX/Sxy family DNA transformation protein [Thioclava sp.]|nr:TfoX/Sxy family DNA transformation protein [Thioclava sp.]MBD3804249.1 TfoX/Sxy family DNA transformation protein [Thioclava sp.]